MYAHFRVNCSLFYNRTIGSEAAFENCNPSFCMNWVFQSFNDLFIQFRVDYFKLADVFSDGFAVNRKLVKVEFGRKPLHNCFDPACPIEMEHEIGTSGPQGNKVGRFLAQFVKGFKRQFKPEFMGKGRKVKGCICAPSHCHVDHYGIFKGFVSDDLPWRYVLFYKLNNALSGLLGDANFFCVNGMCSCTPWQTQSEGFGHTCHCVCSEHPGTGPCSCTGKVFKPFKLSFGKFACPEGADTFKD
ncbi:hypothetical protein DSECCO2_640910 [anaerobic digester metagenome]